MPRRSKSPIGPRQLETPQCRFCLAEGTDEKPVLKVCACEAPVHAECLQDYFRVSGQFEACPTCLRRYARRPRVDVRLAHLFGTLLPSRSEIQTLAQQLVTRDLREYAVVYAQTWFICWAWSIPDDQFHTILSYMLALTLYVAAVIVAGDNRPKYCINAAPIMVLALYYVAVFLFYLGITAIVVQRCRRAWSTRFEVDGVVVF